MKISIIGEIRHKTLVQKF